MNQKVGTKKGWAKHLVPLAVVLPLVLICTVFFANRSLFLDGINLARNVVEGSFLDLAQPLNYEQSAPLLFLYLAKIATLILGVSEYSLRLVPFLSALACLYFFAGAGRKLMPIPLAALALFWMGSHSMFVRYATEFKQYMTDAFVAIFLIWLVLRLQNISNKRILILGLAGAVCIWLSMPSIFVLFGILCFVAYHRWEAKVALIPVFALGIWYALNLYVEYNLILDAALSSDHMQQYHQSYFLEGTFWNLESLKHDFGLLVASIRMIVGKSGLAIGAAMLLILIGMVDFIKNRKKVGLLLIMPILAVFGASLLRQYSLIERLMLFTMPIFFLLIFHGLHLVMKKTSKWSRSYRYILLFLLVLGLTAGYEQTQGIKYFIHPLKVEDNKSPLLYISKHESSNRPIVCTQLAYPSYDYYTQKDKNHKNDKIGAAVAAKYNESVSDLALDQLQRHGGPVWVFMAHMSDKEIDSLVQELDKKGEIKNSYRSNQSAAILFSTQ